jgi:hypothetical protein
LYLGLRFRDSLTVRDSLTFALGTPNERRVMVAVGVPFGMGRIVAVGGGDIFSNGTLRICNRAEGILAMRMLEWLSEPVGRRLIFDEYHQGYGRNAMGMAAVRRALVTHPAGRVALQLLLCAVILILALGPRAVPPQNREVIERRSPLEHVGALARAYENVGATRRGTALLIRGLRRRHDAAAWRRGSDEDFLRSIAAVHPELGASVSLLVDANSRKTTPAEFIKVGEAVELIERTLSSDYSRAGV